jgi:hypothetical protein
VGVLSLECLRNFGPRELGSNGFSRLTRRSSLGDICDPSSLPQHRWLVALTSNCVQPFVKSNLSISFKRANGLICSQCNYVSNNWLDGLELGAWLVEFQNCTPWFDRLIIWFEHIQLCPTDTAQIRDFNFGNATRAWHNIFHHLNMLWFVSNRNFLVLWPEFYVAFFECWLYGWVHQGLSIEHAGQSQ